MLKKIMILQKMKKEKKKKTHPKVMNIAKKKKTNPKVMNIATKMTIQAISKILSNNIFTIIVKLVSFSTYFSHCTKCSINAVCF